MFRTIKQDEILRFRIKGSEWLEIGDIPHDCKIRVIYSNIETFHRALDVLKELTLNPKTLGRCIELVYCGNTFPIIRLNSL